MQIDNFLGVQRRRSQVVRQRSAKPPFISSNLIVASRIPHLLELEQEGADTLAGLVHGAAEAHAAQTKKRLNN